MSKCKIVIELKNSPKKGDILVYKDGEFECISKNMLLQDVYKTLAEHDISLSNLVLDIISINNEIKILKGEEEDA